MLRERLKMSGDLAPTSTESGQERAASDEKDEEHAAQTCFALLRDLRATVVQDIFEEGANSRVAMLSVPGNPAVFLHNAFQPVIVILFLVMFLSLVGAWVWIGASPRNRSVSEEELQKLYHQVIQHHPLLRPSWVVENQGWGQEPSSELGEVWAVRLCSSRHRDEYYQNLEAQEAWLGAAKSAAMKVPRLQFVRESVEALFALDGGDTTDVAREVVDACSRAENSFKRGQRVSSESGLRVLRQLESALKHLCQGGKPCLTSETGEKKSVSEWAYFVVLWGTFETSLESRVVVSTGVGAAIWVSLEGAREVVHKELKEGFRVIMRMWFEWSAGSEAAILSFLKPSYRLRFFLASAGDYRLKWDFQDLQRQSLALFLNALKSVMHLSTESEIVTHKELGIRSWDVGDALKESNRTDALWIVPETFMEQLPQLARRWTSVPVVAEPRVGRTGIWHCGFWWNPPGAPAVRFARKGGASGSKAVTVHQWGILAAGMSAPASISEVTKQATVSINSERDSPGDQLWKGGRKEWIVSHEEFGFVTRLWVARIRGVLGLPSVSILGHIRQRESWGGTETEESWGSVTRAILRGPKYGVVTGYEQSQRMYPNASTPQQVAVEIPMGTGLTDWEIRKLQRAALRVYVFQTLRRLRGLARILKSQPKLLVVKSAAACTQRAFQTLWSVSRRTADRMSETVLVARAMAQMADECLFHNTVTGELYFPPEFVVAVYLPLLLPIGVSITMASLRLIKRHKRMRAKA